MASELNKYPTQLSGVFVALKAVSWLVVLLLFVKYGVYKLASSVSVVDTGTG
jgi:hypothetical protein